MSYTIEMCADNAVYLELLGEVDSQEVFDACQQLRDDFLEKTSTPIHIIVDSRSISQYPTNLPLLHRATTIYASHANCAWIVLLVNENKLSKFFGKVITHALNREFLIESTLENALTTLSRMGNNPAQAT